MAIIAIALTDLAPIRVAWERPPDYFGNRSPVPQGLAVFAGTGAVAAKDAANFTNLSITLTMPDGYAYLPRNLLTRFQSDDLVNDFDANGQGNYGLVGRPFSPVFNLVSPGLNNVSCVNANRIWFPGEGAAKAIMRPLSTIAMRMHDMSTDASTAGDAFWYAEFYVFNVDQVDKWEVNTPIPVISHTSF